jgi:hypothetical protein
MTHLPPARSNERNHRRQQRASQGSSFCGLPSGLAAPVATAGNVGESEEGRGRGRKVVLSAR